MILELCGGEPGEVTEAGAPAGLAARRHAALRAHRRSRRLRHSAGRSGRRRCNASASPCSTRDATRVTVAVPSWRNDIAAPIVLDQAPDARSGGRREGRRRLRRDRTGMRPGRGSAAPARPRCGAAGVAAARRAGAAADADAAAAAHRTGPPHAGGAGPGRVRHLQLHGAAEAALFGATPEALRLTNPIAADLDQLRPTPIATLALAAKRNAARGYPDVALFEIGPEFAVDAAGRPAPGRRRPARRRHAAQLARAVAAGRCDGRQGRSVGRAGRGRRADGGADGDARMRPAFYHPGRSGHGAPGTEDGAGQLRRTASARAGGARPGRPGGGVRAEPGCRRRSRSAAASAAPDLPAFQPVRRDFAFLVDAAVTADAVLRAARGAERTLIAGVVAVRRLSRATSCRRARSRWRSR